MLLPERNDQGSEGYRYGFQGQEGDDEIKGKGNSLNYTFRMHDSRIGRFFSVDPLAPKYPHYTPYSFSGNRVIDAIELEGLEERIIIKEIGRNGKVKRITYYHIENSNNRISPTYQGVAVYTISRGSSISSSQVRNFKRAIKKSTRMEDIGETERLTLVAAAMTLRTTHSNKANSDVVKGEQHFFNYLSERRTANFTGSDEASHTPSQLSIYFQHDNAKINWSSPENAGLKDVIQDRRTDYILLSEQSGDYEIVLEAHTSLTGDNHYNHSLALKRANAVKNYLVSKGADPEKIKINVVGETSHGDKDPNDDGTHSDDNSDAEKENRKVTIELHSK